MLFLVDGYNVTKGDPATRDLTLEDQREALVARLRARGEQLLGRGSIVVVFDGESGRASDAQERLATYPIEVAFSRGVTADDAIVKRATHGAGEKVCLVSSDHGLADRLRDHLGKRLDVRARDVAFESARGPASRARPRAGMAREAGLPRNAAGITEELKRHWLKDEE